MGGHKDLGGEYAEQERPMKDVTPDTRDPQEVIEEKVAKYREQLEIAAKLKIDQQLALKE